MQPSKVRETILSQHEALRRDLERIEALATQVAAGAAESVTHELRRTAIAFLDELESHMSWEDQRLTPALADADAWGSERVDLLAADHKDQRQQMRTLIDHLQDSERSPLGVAAEILALVERLRVDMAEEEAGPLSDKVLRDDVIAIDMEDG